MELNLNMSQILKAYLESSNQLLQKTSLVRTSIDDDIKKQFVSSVLKVSFEGHIPLFIECLIKTFHKDISQEEQEQLILEYVMWYEDTKYKGIPIE